MHVCVKVTASVEHFPCICYYWLVLQLLGDWVELCCHSLSLIYHDSFKPHRFAIQTSIWNIVVWRSISHHLVNTRLWLITVDNSFTLLLRLNYLALFPVIWHWFEVFFKGWFWRELRLIGHLLQFFFKGWFWRKLRLICHLLQFLFKGWFWRELGHTLRNCVI